MPIMSKTTALTVYKAEALPNRSTLVQHAFRSIDNTAEALSYGAVNFDDYLDVSWAKSLPEKGEFLAFGLRVDARRVPGPVLKKHFAQAMEEEKRQRAERGEKLFISKDRKTEIKEQVMLRLRAKAEPVPAAFDVVVDETSKLVYFASSSAKPKQYLEALWMAMTGEVLEELTPFVLAPHLPIDTEDASKFLTSIFNEPQDFRGATFSVPNKATLSSVEQRAVVALDSTMGADLPALSAPMEDRRAIKATLEIVDTNDEFTLGVRASDFGITGLKTPPVNTKLADGEEPDGPFLEKMYLIGKAVGLLHGAFRDFTASATPSEGQVSGEEF